MLNFKKYLGVFLASGLFFFGLYFWRNFTSRFWLILVISLVFLLEIGLFYLFNHERIDFSRKFYTMIITFLGLVFLLSVMEDVLIARFLNVLGAVLMGLVFSLPKEEEMLIHERKPWRRLMNVLLTWNLFALFTFVFALNVFLPSLPFWLISFLGGLFAGGVSMVMWGFYFNLEKEKFFLWGLIIALALSELMWVIHLLPLGYLVSGFLTVWPWYIWQLLVRFHLSPGGLEWKKQIPFLVFNIICFVLFLVFIVKWI
ncbi:MAG: hypothetical protein US42_C0016G0019 [Candidatus Magasanikbacteria bacterium GW2011_GWC2_37_14]|uniref:Uncharacterized protein n=1 Tax=Candidatus Magasanikbacteria bacterium GW2011_GWC2_37_14 TaxID=1619046 RepID=A0A0G0IS84_9BACT|nr:MAG: hypothetical protein US42_C0016G0019 [Candidatus Magasanikbacteria bacterium GW2011_GWC2_37_14]